MDHEYLRVPMDEKVKLAGNDSQTTNPSAGPSLGARVGDLDGLGVRSHWTLLVQPPNSQVVVCLLQLWCGAGPAAGEAVHQAGAPEGRVAHIGRRERGIKSSWPILRNPRRMTR